MTELPIGKLIKNFGHLLGLRTVAGQAGIERVINTSDTHRPGMALMGFVELFTVDQLQILGNTEMEYLRNQSPSDRKRALEILYQFEIPCIVITGRGRMIPELKALAEEYGVPLLRSEFETARFNHLFHFYLDDVFAPQVTLHGTLVDVHGIGLLFKGRSAIGKSEVGLDLVERGHRLVADDAVNITRKSQGILVGTSSRTAPRPHGNSRYRNHGHKENVRCARDSETEEDRSSRSIGGLGRDNVVRTGWH